MINWTTVTYVSSQVNVKRSKMTKHWWTILHFKNVKEKMSKFLLTTFLLKKESTDIHHD